MVIVFDYRTELTALEKRGLVVASAALRPKSITLIWVPPLFRTTFRGF